MQAVSFTKGCYLGQEIVERIRAQGHVNKKLVRLRVAGDTPLDAGAKLTVNGSAAGEITSSIYSPESNAIAAMAYVRSAFAEPGTELEVNGSTASVV